MDKKLKDNISVCSGCDKHTNDNKETKWDEYGDPYCKKCYEGLPQNQKPKTND